MFQTGSTINPALGRTDYSAYAQGAIAGGQAIGQGIANLAQDFANGIEKYQKKKEEKQKLDEATSFIGNLLKKNPQLATNFNLTPDENGNFDEGAIRSAAKVVGPTPFLQLAQQSQEFNRTQEKESRIARASLALANGIGLEGVPIKDRLAALEKQGYSSTDLAAASAYASKQQADQSTIATQNANLGKTIAETALLKIPKPVETVYGDPATALAAGSNALKLSKTEGYDVLPTLKAGGFGYEFVKKAPAPVAPVGYKFNPDGTLGIIAGGPVDVEQKAAQAKLATESTDKQAELLKTYSDTSDSALRNLNKIKGAADLVKYGNLSAGLGSGIAEFFRGSDVNDLKSALTSIKSSLAIDKIIELKKSSKSGSTGFGALNLEELKALQSDIANLDQTQSRKSLINGLNSVYDRYSKVVAALPQEYQFEVPPFAATARVTKPESLDKVDTNQYANPNAKRVKGQY